MATKNDRRTPWMATHPGTILKYELEERDLSQKDFATMIDMQKSHVSEFITGKRPITMSIAEKIERKLGVSALSLVNLQNKYEYDTNVINQRKIDINKIKQLPTTEDMFVDEYGARGTAMRDEFDAKSRAWYYAEVLKNARKAAGITQQQLAEKIGKKREYVAMLEKGETDMQLSTFIMISEAVGLKFALTY